MTIPINAKPPCEDDPEMWFTPGHATPEYLASSPEVRNHNLEALLRAKFICMAECPFQQDCLKAGMNEEYGIWGGYTTAEREKMKEGKLHAPSWHLPVPPSRHTVKFFMQGWSTDQLADGKYSADGILRLLQGQLWRLRLAAGDVRAGTPKKTEGVRAA